MTEMDPDKDNVGGQPADAAPPDIERVVADLRLSVQQHRVKAEAARVRAEAVASELIATRAGRHRVFGDEQFQERLAQLLRDVEAVSDQVVAQAGQEARARRAAADLDADRTLTAARGEAQSLLDQARDAAEQALAEGETQIASLDGDRDQLESERLAVLGALTSLHDRLGNLASTIGEQS